VGNKIRKTARRPKTERDAKAAAEIRKAAQAYGKRAMAILWAIASAAESDNARIAACKEILDRGYGKEGRLPPSEQEKAAIRRIERIIVDPKD
jgi:lactam utilization protein B